MQPAHPDPTDHHLSSEFLSRVQRPLKGFTVNRNHTSRPGSAKQPVGSIPKIERVAVPEGFGTISVSNGEAAQFPEVILSLMFLPITATSQTSFGLCKETPRSSLMNPP